jgi:hypothetical protein
MSTTSKGDTLADKLNPAIGTTLAIRETCAAICRTAATLDRLATEECNGPDWMDSSDRWIGQLWQQYKRLGGTFPPAEDMAEDLSKAYARAKTEVRRHSDKIDRWGHLLAEKQERAERRFLRQVEDLPHTDVGPFKGQPIGDPRGCSLIIAPEGSGIHGDSWGDRNGVCVP